MTRPDFAAGRRLLQILLPRAKEIADQSTPIWKPQSALGRSVGPYMRLDNVDAVMIYQAPKGGWHGDVVLKQVPDGVPDVLGTPVENPCPTREMAVDFAISLLAQFIGRERSGEKSPPIAMPVFLFHGYEFNLMSDILEQIPGYSSTERALARLSETEKEIFPHGITEQEFSLEGEKYAILMTVIHMAAKTGVHRYPAKQDTEPKKGPYIKTDD